MRFTLRVTQVIFFYRQLVMLFAIPFYFCDLLYFRVKSFSTIVHIKISQYYHLNSHIVTVPWILYWYHNSTFYFPSAKVSNQPTKNTKAQRQTQEEPLLEFFFTYRAEGGAVYSLYRVSRATQTVKTETK